MRRVISPRNLPSVPQWHLGAVNVLLFVDAALSGRWWLAGAFAAVLLASMAVGTLHMGEEQHVEVFEEREKAR